MAESLQAPELVVRRARPEELDAAALLAARLVQMHHEADPGRFFLPPDVERGYRSWFRQEHERREAAIVVAVRGSAVVGYAYGTLEGRDWNLLLDRHGAIHDVYVAESERLRGTGRRLMEEITRELEALGAPRVVLSTMVSNTAAQRLFASVGFRPTMLEMTRGG
jgi:ribosomal protein S18 acetylase RimI-like enzyme